MQLSSERFDTKIEITVEEERIDAASAIQFKDSMAELCADSPPTVILRLGNVTFVDSSGLGAIVAVMKLLGSEKSLELADLNPGVAKVFLLTRMDKVFTIHQPTTADVDPVPHDH
jgi:anti-sigma B factor antagonist